MNLEAHLHELNEKHRAMEVQIESEMLSPSSDSLLITELKRRKLRLKDEIVRLQAKEAA